MSKREKARLELAERLVKCLQAEIFALEHRRARAGELRRAGETLNWLVASDGECQALLDGEVSAAIQKQAELLLKPDLVGKEG